MIYPVFFFGVVEDRMDPFYLGRCRVRIRNLHNEDVGELPTEDLPWAYPIQSIRSAGISGVGETPLGPVEGTEVVGFFLDGAEGQIPVFFGTTAGMFVNEPLEKYGFRDPNGLFPRQSYLEKKEVDTNRLARRQSTAETVVKTKDDARHLNVPTAFGGSWDQPRSPFNPSYPFNYVLETENGHIEEWDDTPGNERIHRYHKSGTFTEIDVNGTQVTRIVGDGYEIVERNSRVHIKGKCDVTIEGQANVYVMSDCNLEVDGNLKAHAHGNIELKAGGSLALTAAEGIDINAGNNVSVKSGDKVRVNGSKGIALHSSLKTTISSPITEMAVLKFNGMTMTPIPPIFVPFSISGTIGGGSPKNPSFPDLSLPSRRPDTDIPEFFPMTEKVTKL